MSISLLTSPYFFHAEYSVRVIEEAEYLNNKIKQLRERLRKMSLLSYSGEIEEFLNNAQKDLDEVTIRARQMDDILPTIRLEGLLKKISDLLVYIEQAINQRYDLLETERKLVEQQGIHADVLDIYRAIDIILQKILSTYLKLQDLSSFHLFVSGVNFDFSSILYNRYGKYVFVFRTPSIDVVRAIHWPCFAHEASHIRIGLLSIPPEIGKQRFYELAGSYVQELSKVVLRTEYGMLDTRLKEIINNQLVETLADIMSTIVVGPSSLLSLSTLTDPMTETEQASDHPPLLARIHCMFKVMETMIKHNDFLNLLDQIRAEWRVYIKNMILSKLRSKRYSNFIKDYEDIIDQYFQDLLQMARSLISGSEPMEFNYDKWISAKTFIESNFDIQTKNLDIVALLNVPWAYSLIDFPKKKEKCSRGKLMIDSYKEEPRYTEHIVRAILARGE